MKIQSLLALILLGAGSLAADDGVTYQVNARLSLPSKDVKALGFTGSGVGGGFAVLLGREAMKARLRVDGDSFSGSGPSGSLNAYGVGIDGVLVQETDTFIRPTFSIGLVGEKWKLGPLGTPDGRSAVYRVGGRVEVGGQYGNHIGFHVGILAGRIGFGRKAKNAYFGISVMGF